MKRAPWIGLGLCLLLAGWMAIHGGGQGVTSLQHPVEPDSAALRKGASELRDLPVGAKRQQEPVPEGMAPVPVEGLPGDTANPVYLEGPDGSNFAELVSELRFLAPPVVEVRAVDAPEILGAAPTQLILTHFERAEPRAAYGGEPRVIGHLQPWTVNPKFFALVLEDRVLAQLPASAEELRYRLHAADLWRVFGSLQVRCRCAPGQALPPGQATIHLPWSGGVPAELSHGTNRWQGLAPGPQHIELRFPGYLPRVLEVELLPGQALDVGELVFEASRSVRGRVEGADAGGRPVQLVRWTGEPPERQVEQRFEVTTAPDGDFFFGDLPPGTYALRVARRPQYFKTLTRLVPSGGGLEIAPEQESSERVLTRDGWLSAPHLGGLRAMRRSLLPDPTTASVLLDLRQESVRGLRCSPVAEVPVTFHAPPGQSRSVRVLDEWGLTALEFETGEQSQPLSAWLLPGLYSLYVTRHGQGLRPEPVQVGAAGGAIQLP